MLLVWYLTSDPGTGLDHKQICKQAGLPPALRAPSLPQTTEHPALELSEEAASSSISGSMTFKKD